MASLRKRPGSDKWVCCYTLPDGARTQKSTGKTNRGEAMAICLQWAHAAKRALEGNFTEAQARKLVSEIAERSGVGAIEFATTDERRSRAARVEVRALGSAMFTAQAWEQIAHRLGLSSRELQIMRGVFDDRIEYAIAADLGISPHTVHTHFDRLRRKLGVGNRPQLILRVVNVFLTLTTSPESLLSSISANHTAGRCPPRPT